MLPQKENLQADISSSRKHRPKFGSVTYTTETMCVFPLDKMNQEIRLKRRT